MKLTKFLRRYSRILLMIFMSLLLVVFLIGDVLQNAMTKRQNPKMLVGRSAFGDIYNTDTLAAQIKQDLLRRMGFGDLVYLEPIDVHLLMQEARRMGVRIGREQVKSMLTQVFPVELAEQRLAALQQQTGRSYDSIYDVVGEWLAVEQLVLCQASAVGNSLPRAELAFRDEKQEADVTLSVIDSKALLSLVPEPNEGELQAFFDETKDRATAHTEDELQFGCLLPDRVGLEYLTVDPKKIQPKVRIREREARRFFDEYKQNYTKPVSPPAATQSSQPATVPSERVPMTYEEAREEVRRDCRANKAIIEAQSLMNEIQHTAYQPWQAQPRDEAGFRVPPPAETMVPFTELRERFSQRYEVTYEQTDLLDPEGLVARFDTRPAFIREQQGLRGSPEPVYLEGRTEVPISQLALRVKGIFTPEPEDRLPVLDLLEPSPVLQNRGRNSGTRQQDITYQSFVFRVTEVAPSAPPAALDAVREQLVEDYRLLKAHEMAGEFARQIGEQARADGLAAAVEQATALKDVLTKAEEAWQPPPPEPGKLPAFKPRYVRALGPDKPRQPLTRNSDSLRLVGEDTQKVQREVFELVDAPATDSRPAHDVVVVNVANAFKWVVVELEGIKPLYAGEYDQERPALLGGGLDRYTLMALKGAWIAPTNVRQRCGYQPYTPDQAPTAPAQ